MRLEGLRLGRRQGRNSGRGEGQAALAPRQAERKFGAAAARQVSLLLKAGGGWPKWATTVVDCTSTLRRVCC